MKRIVRGRTGHVAGIPAPTLPYSVTPILLSAVLLVLCAMPVASRAASVVINEFMAVNGTSYTNKLTKCADWIELCNTTSSNIDLTGWYLTDDPGNLKKWTIPSTNIASFGYVIIWADSYTSSVYMGELHATNISLSAGGEYLALVRRDGSNVEYQYSPKFSNQTVDVSYGIRPATSNVVLVADAANCKYSVPQNASAGTNWIKLTGFDDAGWSTGQTGIGYETNSSDYGALIRTQVPVGTTGVYIRIPFNYAGGLELASLTLGMKCDDGFVAYLNGTRIRDANVAASNQWDSPAITENANSLALESAEYDVSQYMSLLVPGTNILAIHLMNYSADPEGSDLLAVPELVAEVNVPGIGTDWRYFHTPTPGARNVLGANDYLKEVEFSVDHGYYSDPFDLYLTNNVSDAVIKYTLNFTTPGPNNGIVYSNVIRITPTAVVRATALKPGYEQSPMVSQTYIDMTDALHQPTNPAGFPAMWNSTVPRYGMDTAVVTYAEYVPQLTNAFLSIPTISLVSDTASIFSSSNGIYANFLAAGIAWERPCTLEWINPDGTKGFTIACGARITGGWSRDHVLKKSFRVQFKNRYGGNGKLNYKVFDEDDAATSFDELVLGDKGCVDVFGGVWNVVPQFMKNQITQDFQIRTGGPGVHFTYAHLFINGLYWGMYSPMERPEQTFAASYGGGNPEDWDSIHDGYPAGDSTTASWGALFALGQQGLTNSEIYMQIQGLNLDGSRNIDYDDLLDMDNYIDYLLSNFIVGNTDWPSHNYYAVCGKGTYRDGFKFVCWDAEAGLNSLQQDMSGCSGGAASHYWPYGLKASPEFKLLFADHVQRHFYNGGCMSAEKATARYDEISRKIEKAIILESARWGVLNSWRDSALAWRTQRDYFVRDFFPQRSGVVVQQFKAAGLFPAINAPVFNQFGGAYTNGFKLAMAASNTIYYTLNGTDPRQIVTGIPVGTVYSNPVTLVDTVLVRARSYGVIGGTNIWSALSEAWFSPAGQLGLRVSEMMFNPAAPATNSPFKRSDFEFLELWNSGGSSLDLKHTKVTEGIEFEFTNTFVLAPNDYCVLVENTAAFTSRYGTAGINIAGQFGGGLDDSGEQIRIKAVSGGETLVSVDYSDGRDWPLAADGAGHSLVPDSLEDQTNGVFDCGLNWRASAYIGGSPGRADPDPVRDVVLNEIVAHTDVTNVPGYDSNDWIEMYNLTGGGITLSNWFLSDDPDDLRKWAIPATNVIPAHGWKTFDEVSGFHCPITNGFGISKDGEQVYLSYLAGLTNDRVADCISFKAQENGWSLGRYGDGSNAWYALSVLTTNAANAAPGARVVISEIMYHPAPTLQHPEDNTVDEYVELYNTENGPVNLWTEAGTWRISGVVEYIFPTNTVIGSRERVLLVTFDPARADVLAGFKSVYNLTNEAVRFFGPYRGRLSNRGGRVAVERPQHPDPPQTGVGWVVVDETVYSDGPPWPAGADGSGQPLQRVDNVKDGNDPGNWSDVFAPSPGMWRAKLGLSSPQNNTGYILPFEVRLVAAVDEEQVVGSMSRLDFMVDSNVVGTVTNAPYEMLLTTITNVGTFDLSARLVDGEGTNTSTKVSIYTMKLDNDKGASRITDVSAVLNGHLTGNGLAAVTVYWGSWDGGTNKGGWERAESLGILGNGDFSTELLTLTASRTYFYRVYGINAQKADGWSDSTATFTSLSLGAWSNIVKISFPGYTRSEAIHGFPALVVFGTNIPGFSYSQMGFTNASDLRFTDANRLTMLDFEIEEWNTNGSSYVWVQLPRLSDANDYIYAYVGNTNAIHLPASTKSGAIWPASHKFVWHMSSDLSDATANRAGAFDSGTSDTNGLIGRCRSFPGDTNVTMSSDQVDSTWYRDNMLSLTLSMWVRPEAVIAGGPFGAHTFRTSRTSRRLHIAATNAQWEFGLRTEINNQLAVSTNQWQMLTLVMSNGKATVYKNGRSASQIMNYTNGNPLANDYLFEPDYNPAFGFVNGHSNAVFAFKGYLDEVRIASTALSSNWIWATWINVASNTPFVSYGDVTNNEVIPDSDADGMVDEWEVHNFGGVNEPDSGPSQDRDGDGYNNLYEYIAGTDPTNSADYLYIELLQDAEKKLCARYWTRESTGTVYLGMTRYYGLENASGLVPVGWTSVENCTNITGSGRIDITNLPPDSAMFYRVKVNLR